MTWSAGNYTDLIGGVGGYIAGRAATKNNNLWVAYRNKVRNLQTAAALDTIQQNKVTAQEDHVNNTLEIKRRHLKANAAATASAAFNGTSGKSVDATLRSTSRNAGIALYGEQKRFNRDLDQLNKSVSDAKYTRDISKEQFQSGPSVVGLALGQVAAQQNRKLDAIGSDGTSKSDSKSATSDVSSLLFEGLSLKGLF